MATEIERKFLVRDAGWREHARGSTRYLQGYLSSAETCSIRVRVSDERAWLNIKGATLDVTRQEFDYPIPLEDAREILAHLCDGAPIEKRRWWVPWGAHTWEIDVFEGENAGLVVAELELGRADEAFEPPPWIGEEVSDDPRYYNVCLARHPYREWGAR